MTELLAAVDVGTTALKAGVFDRSGQLLALAERGCPPRYLPDGRVQADPAAWATALSECLGSCFRKVRRAHVRAIAVSSQAQTHVLLDRAGRAIGPAVSWLDATGDAVGVESALPPARFYRHVGWPRPLPQLAVTHLRAYGLRRGSWRGVARLVFADGFVIERLTGEAAVSRNLAAMSGLYSMPRAGWWPEALAVARVPAAVLPSLAAVGEPVALLRADLARSWGLDRIPVVAGANDQTAAALGAGLVRPGETTLGLGTAMVTYQVVAADAVPAACRPLCGPYPGGLRYQLLVCSLGGACLEWVRGLVAARRSWDRFFADALAEAPGAGGLRFRPGSGAAGESAALSGIVPGHTGGQVVRAVLEGVAAAAREQLDALAVRGTVRLTGGGARHDGWAQMLADATGRTLERVEQPHAGLWGTAVAAGHGAGLFGDMLAAARAGRARGRVFRPGAAARRRRTRSV